MKMQGFPSTWCSPRLVIPAHAGIQVCCAELAWIPAFAGMTEPRRAFRSHPKRVFSKEVTKSTKLRSLEISMSETFVSFVIFVVKKQGDSARLSTEKLEVPRK